MRQGDRTAPPRPGRDRVDVQAGDERRRRGRGQGVVDLVDAAHPSATVAPPRRHQPEAGQQVVIRPRRPPPAPRRPRRRSAPRAAVRPPSPATRGSAALSTAVPSAGSASTSSPLARATSSIVPNTSVWTAADRASRSPTVGDAMAHSVGDVARRPGPHLHDHRLGAVGRVQQRERHAQLVVERPLAGGRRQRSASTAASRSFTDVLPTEPVTPMTRRRAAGDRARRPAACSAATVSSTTMAVPPLEAPGREVGRRPVRERRGDELVPVALGRRSARRADPA